VSLYVQALVVVLFYVLCHSKALFMLESFVMANCKRMPVKLLLEFAELSPLVSSYCDVVYVQVIPKFIALLERNRRWLVFF